MSYEEEREEYEERIYEAGLHRGFWQGLILAIAVTNVTLFVFKLIVG